MLTNTSITSVSTSYLNIFSKLVFKVQHYTKLVPKFEHHTQNNKSSHNQFSTISFLRNPRDPILYGIHLHRLVILAAPCAALDELHAMLFDVRKGKVLTVFAEEHRL